MARRLRRTGHWLLWLIFPFIGRPDRAARRAAELSEEEERARALEESLAPYRAWEARQDAAALEAYRSDLQAIQWHRRGRARHYLPLMRKHGIEPPPKVDPPLTR